MFSRQQLWSSYYTQCLNDDRLVCSAFVMHMLPAARCNPCGWHATRAEPENSFLKYAVTQFRFSMCMDSRKAQILAALIQLYSGNTYGSMLPMLTWAKLTSKHKANKRSGGYVITIQMDTCTAGKHVSETGAMALGVLSAEAAKCASTTPWLPRLLWLQLNGILRQTRAHLTVWWHKATSLLLGSVMSAVTSGVQHPISGSARIKLAARSAAKLQDQKRTSVTQPLQGATTLFWQSGITGAMQLRGIFLAK